MADLSNPRLSGISVEWNAARDRRRGAREIALMRVAMVQSAEANDICVIRNISETGLSARVYRLFAKGESVALEIRSGRVFTGTVVWTRENDIGVEFERPIDLQDALSNTIAPSSQRRRSLPRIDLRCQGQIATTLNTIKCQLRDIGQGGASLDLEKPISELMAVKLFLPALPPIDGVVRWSSGLTIGMSFNACLAFDQLALWIQNAREARDEASRNQ